MQALAERMDTDEVGAAQGIIRVANSNMVRAIRRISVERGFDPREFTLLAFGGAGPLHACGRISEDEPGENGESHPWTALLSDLPLLGFQSPR